MRWKVEKKQGGHGGKREERTWRGVKMQEEKQEQ